MAVATVTAANTNTRVNDSDANTNWGNWSSSGSTPASEAQLKYQGNSTVNKKITSSTRGGIDYDPGASPLDMTAAANKLCLFKGYVADFGDLNTTWGVNFGLGSANNAYYEYNVAGTGNNRSPVFDTYPAQGGYLIVAIDPNIAAWREATTGSPAITAVDWFGMQAAFIVGGAKTENLALDAIDVGTGLQLYGGDGGSTDAAFQDLVDADQGTVANRWGYVTQSAGAIFIRGMMEIGRNNVTATATEFTDTSATTVFFPDGYHSAGLFGLDLELGHASTIFNIGSNLIGQGSITTEDTRPDHVLTGTAGTYTLTGQILNHRNVTFTSACTADGATIGCQLLTQASADIENCTIFTVSLTSIACLQDPTFGATTGLNNTEFVQAGAGHALEIDTAGDYDFTNIFFTGYGTTTSDSAAIDITATSGTVTINVLGGDSPTYKTAGATVVISVSVPLAWAVIDKDAAVIAGAQISVYKVSDDSEVITPVDTDVNGEVNSSFAGTTPVDIYYRVRKSSAGDTKYVLFSAFGTIESSTGLSATVTLKKDTNNNT